MSVPQATPVACSWSGGKDSCFALYTRLKENAAIKVLVNMMNEEGKISRSHGLPHFILQQQAEAMGVPLITAATSWSAYEETFIRTLKSIKEDFEIGEMVFGDIDLREHRDWEEMVCEKAGINANLPLWKQDRKSLVEQMIREDFHSIIVSCNTVLGEEFLGKSLTAELLPELENSGVDVCGENGEFHTVVVNCPMFNQPILLPAYTKVKHESYWFLQWET